MFTFWRRNKYEYATQVRLSYLEQYLIEAEVEMDLARAMHLDEHAEAFRGIAMRCYETAVNLSDATGVPLPRYINLLQRELEASS